MIKWDEIYKLSSGEFSEDPDMYAEDDLIYALSDLRLDLKKKMFPSPVPGALARLYGSPDSQHYAIGRKSTGSDQFIEGVPFDIYSTIMRSCLFNGIGIYLKTNGPDGKPWIMFHLDIREREFPLIWIVEKVWDVRLKKHKDYYRYPQTDSKYWKLFNDEMFFRDKQYGSR